eukprot:TRINITY_DN1382_c0_g1_i3.p1 TRINITY_DN1382_c0_g1~~TRINITY_DN1382_c0_g1_i3.p1  ORF type:complete len:111 (+),score=21.57 TRINITY_DN1382_c0_g1_i3:72-404(+)
MSSIDVQGAGELSFNGIFHSSGKYRGKPQWNKPNTRVYIRWRGGEEKDQYERYGNPKSGNNYSENPRWEFYIPGGFTYYYHEEDSPNPPTEGWSSTDYAEYPPPTLKFEN